MGLFKPVNVAIHEDSRRIIAHFHDSSYPELIGSNVCGGSLIMVKDSNSVIGNHYHSKKDELFYFIEGNGILRLEDPLTKEKEEVVLSKPIAFIITKGIAHSFKLKEGSKLIHLALSNEKNYHFRKSEDNINCNLII